MATPSPRRNAPQKPRKRPLRSPETPSQASLWPSPRRFRGVRGGEIVRAAIMSAGAKLLAGGDFEPRPKPKTHPLLEAIDQSPAVRRIAGRIDVSGAKDAAAWASFEGGEFELFYRFGREVCADLVAAIEPLFAAHGLRAVRSAAPLLRQRPGGAWAALIRLESAPARARSIMAR